MRSMAANWFVPPIVVPIFLGVILLVRLAYVAWH
jgi:hypothetical protein